MSKYPIFLELDNKKVVVIGAGSVAADKVKKLLAAGAKVTVIALEAGKEFSELKSKVTFQQADYSKDQLTGAILVIAATNDQQLNQQVYRDCYDLNILCNVVDSPELCDFYVPAVAQRGSLQIAVSTDGKCPAYAGRIRKQLEKQFTQEHGRFLDDLELVRQRILEEISEADKRKKLLQELVTDESFEYYKQNGPAAWRDRAENIIKNVKN
jgi:precorrin-2 dehydrogenase/sirohydrochlorin ferrochelatase